MNKAAEYLNTYWGQELLKQTGSVHTEGIWQIYSEDTSDYGGCGNSSVLDVVTGRLSDVIAYAFTLKKFFYYQGGRIVQILPTKNITPEFLKQHQDRLERLEILKRETDELERQLGEHLE